jgi:RsiW-degrading membrane proteinase PrsW (M82 family)
MDVWRVIGAVIVGLGGVLLVMVAMAQARDSAIRFRRRGDEPPPARVLRTALLGLAILGVTLVLVLTVLPQLAVWTLSALIWLILGVLFLID